MRVLTVPQQKQVAQAVRTRVTFLKATDGWGGLPNYSEEERSKLLALADRVEEGKARESDLEVAAWFYYLPYTRSLHQGERATQERGFAALRREFRLEGEYQAEEAEDTVAFLLSVQERWDRDAGVDLPRTQEWSAKAAAEEAKEAEGSNVDFAPNVDLDEEGLKPYRPGRATVRTLVRRRVDQLRNELAALELAERTGVLRVDGFPVRLDEWAAQYLVDGSYRELSGWEVKCGRLGSALDENDDDDDRAWRSLVRGVRLSANA